MRRNERAVLEINKIEDIINENILCRVAFNGNPYPYIVPMNYGYHDMKLYFHSAKQGLKIQMIKDNPNVSFEIESESKMIPTDFGHTMKYRSVIGFGKIRICETDAEKQNGLKILMSHHGGKKVEHSQKSLDSVEVLCLEIDSMTGKQNFG